ncbi:MXAN_6640 family putative metalloprotease [Rosettibacter firmus]|uniref:MXAN_6640 family putative metalloprotease n=1 Tax=Rosettibacter firmus TaxID=3111522 RepID=UPI00336C2B74
MKKIILLLNLLLLNVGLLAQNLDSLFYEFLRIKGIESDRRYVTTISDSNYIKCGFGIVSSVRLNYDKFTPKQKIILSQFFTRPTTDASFVTRSGLFRIHFNKAGIHSPKYDLNELARAIDSAYNYEVNILKYPPPPKDFGEGGDDKYDIYIQNLTGGLYGYTENETEIGNRIYTSYIVIDNDFSDTYTKGIDGAKVSVAHELHHAIQIGNYILRNEDQFFHELTSTAMEEFVFDSINDYYSYMPSFFNNPQRAFAYNDGYNLAIWDIFLKERFGFDIIKRSWELFRNERALNAMADAISEYGSSFKNEFALFGQWIFFTNYRTVPNKYFEEAENYPLIKPSLIMEFIQPTTTVEINSEPVSSNYLVFINNSEAVPDTFVAIIANTDITQGVDSPGSKLNLKYILSNQNFKGEKKIIDNYYSKIECDNPFLLTESNILNNRLINEGQISTTDIAYAFPQPFMYSKDDFIYFPAERTKSGYAELYVYSVNMDLIYSGEHKIFSSDKTVIKWNALNNDMKKLASGIYFYFVKSGDILNKGKFVVIND